MTQRYFSSTAGLMALQATISPTSTSIVVDTVTGLPGSTPFTLVLDAGTSLEEICDCTGISGTTLTVTRGIDGSPAQAHTTGATVRHMAIARDFREANTHINSSAGVHGITGSVVGTTDVQTVTNKDLTNASNTFPSSLATLTGTQALTHKDLTDATNSFPGSLATSAALTAHTSATTAHGTSGLVVGTSDAQTLTNKTLASPTLSGIVTAPSRTSTQDLGQMYQHQSAALPSFAGWGDYGGGFATQKATLGYDGIVHIQGFVKRTDPAFSPTSGQYYSFANLTAWAIPATDHMFATATKSGTDIMLRVTSSGLIMFIWLGIGTQPTCDPATGWWISIECSYPLT